MRGGGGPEIVAYINHLITKGLDGVVVNFASVYRSLPTLLVLGSIEGKFFLY